MMILEVQQKLIRGRPHMSHRAFADRSGGRIPFPLVPSPQTHRRNVGDEYVTDIRVFVPLIFTTGEMTRRPREYLPSGVTPPREHLPSGIPPKWSEPPLLMV